MEGWDGTARRRAERPDAPPLAALRPQRRQADLGRRGGRRPARRPRQPQPAGADAGDAAGDRRPARDAGRRASRALRRRTPTATSSSACSSRTRAATPGRRADGGREPQIAYAHPHLDRRFPAGVRDADRRRSRSAGRDVRRRGAAGAGRGVRVRRRQALPRLPGPRAAQRAARGRAATAARSRTARGSCDRSSTASAPRSPASASACGCRRSTWCPFRKSESGVGVPEAGGAVRIGVRRRSTARPRTWTRRWPTRARCCRCSNGMGVRWVCITAGSPYYNPHMQRPALFPPSDGYQPPEDPLVGVARQIDATARLKQDFPSLAIVGSAYSYLQEWLPHVAQYAVRARHDRLRRAGADGAVVSRICRPTCSPAGRCSASRSAARSATAPPARGSAWCRAASRSNPLHEAPGRRKAESAQSGRLTAQDRARTAACSGAIFSVTFAV